MKFAANPFFAAIIIVLLTSQSATSSPIQITHVDSKADTAMVHLEYDRFDVYIPEAYYNANTPSIDDFFDLFEPRFEYLETITGWSAEKFYGNKLQVTLYDLTSGCHSALGGNGAVDLFFADPLYRVECFTAGGINDTATLLGIALHQAAHAIMPVELSNRPWLDYGFPAYWHYNILSHFGDITQQQADSAIFAGDTYFNWADYVANDYRDALGLEIQESFGSNITAWMLTMMAGDYMLNWSRFFMLFNNNLETLTKADSLWQVSPYFSDMVVIELFSRTMHRSFGFMKDLWQYDGPYGAGWGLRQWPNVSWYAELRCDFTVPILFANTPNRIRAVVRNTGMVNTTGVSTRFYVGDSLFSEQFVDVPGRDSVNVFASLTPPAEGQYLLTVIVDAENVKIEMLESNNSRTLTVPCSKCCGYYTGGYTGNTNCDPHGTMNLADVTRLVDRIYVSKLPLCCDENGNVDGDPAGTINLEDVVRLIDHVYQDRTPTAACE